jgi:hypothetical protein
MTKRRLVDVSWLCILPLLFAAASVCSGQHPKPLPEAPSSGHAPANGQQLPVNWLYGAYTPTEAPLESLSDADRWHLYLRQGVTTWGIG